MPSSWVRMLVLACALGFLIALVQLNILALAFEKLGLSPESAYLLLVSTLAGSLINLPLFTMTTQGVDAWFPIAKMGTPFRLLQPPVTGETLVAVNVGGCVIPVSFSIYLLVHSSLGTAETVLSVMIVALVAYAFSRPIPGVGVGIPILIAPAAAALVAMLVDYEQRAPLAYIDGTLGVLVGADVFRLKDIRAMGPPAASIGGAGTFDGIFVAGLIAVLLT